MDTAHKQQTFHAKRDFLPVLIIVLLLLFILWMAWLGNDSRPSQSPHHDSAGQTAQQNK